MHGFQLWANLPSNQKMMNPRYRDIGAEEIPEVELENGIKIKIIAGVVSGVSGPVDDIVIDPEYLDCLLPPAARFIHETKRGYTALLYIIDGKGSVAQTSVSNGTLVLFRGRRRTGGHGRREQRVEVSAALWQAPERACRLERPDRHEHSAGT